MNVGQKPAKFIMENGKTHAQRGKNTQSTSHNYLQLSFSWAFISWTLE